MASKDRAPWGHLRTGGLGECVGVVTVGGSSSSASADTAMAAFCHIHGFQVSLFSSLPTAVLHLPSSPGDPAGCPPAWCSLWELCVFPRPSLCWQSELASVFLSSENPSGSETLTEGTPPPRPPSCTCQPHLGPCVAPGLPP